MMRMIVLVAGVFVAIAAIFIVVFFALDNKSGSDELTPLNEPDSLPVSDALQTSPENELDVETEQKSPLIKNLGVEFGPYDPLTNKAGDFKFTKEKTVFDFNRLFVEYGFIIPASSVGP